MGFEIPPSYLENIFNLDLNGLSDEICSCEPRYILVSYEYRRDDGRVSYPYCLIFSSPRNSPNDLKMLYAGTLHHFTDISQVTKVYELHDLEDLNEEWLIEEMKKKGI
ncbi:unnamed protein product [Hymenolepis diminuta]|uniref:ADF-H domain-containing protein n=1 Tax=Hymenolepis diminuta TaxID=6216 RepID=A0A0R3SX31_HYMDI|nr:unnamed protein product [Hymenolepis diminuta]